MEVELKNGNLVLVRAMVPGDIPRLTAMFARTMPRDFSGIVPDDLISARVAEVETALRGQWPLAYTAQAQGQAVGCALVRDASHLSLIWVDAPWRGGGVGRLLMHAVQKRVKEQGHNVMTLEVYESNEKAVRFYTRLGWTVTKRHMGLVEQWLLGMEKVL